MPPISSGYSPYFPINPEPTPTGPARPSPKPGMDWMAGDLRKLIDDLQSLMADWEANPEAVKKKMTEIKDYLVKHKEDIFKTCEANGWPPDALQNFKQAVNGTINSINNFIKNPNAGSLDMVNEDLTQTIFFLINEKKS